MLVQIQGRTEAPHYDPDFIYVDSEGRVFVMDRGALRQVFAHYDRNDEHTRHTLDMIHYARGCAYWLMDRHRWDVWWWAA